MNDYQTPRPAVIRKHASGWRLPGIWLVPLIAAMIALYLGWRSYSERGPVITVSFNTADGIAAGQTPLRYKAVALGTVISMRINPDTQHIEVKARMAKDAEPYLTDHARFWVVRPRLNSAGLSGVETLISGAYIQLDPGPAGGKEKTRFTGLEDAPGVRSDVPGKTYILNAERIGAIGAGSPVYFRDVSVGEVLNYDIGDGFGPIKLTVFVHSPYDKIIHPGTRFWNASGLWVNAGAGGFHVELQSLQAVLSGGINFATPEEMKDSESSPEKSVFPLYADQEAADASTIHKRVPFVTYFQASIKGLNVGSAVTMYGIRIGTVTRIALIMDTKNAGAKVRVAYEIEPERIFSADAMPDPVDLTRRLVQKGLRAKLTADNLLTGQKSISFEFVPKAKSAEIAMEDDSIVMPAGPAGGIDGITDSMAGVAAKLDQVPFAQIGENLNNLLSHADQGLQPALEKLPQISDDLEQTLAHANAALTSLDQQSDLQRDAKRTMEQLGDAARSLKLLVDFLTRHPEALIRGRTTKEAQ